jgi:hypothetical protein
MSYRFRSTDFELDPALHPSCYQLNVACNLSDRRLLINDIAGALALVGSLSMRQLPSQF